MILKRFYLALTKRPLYKITLDIFGPNKDTSSEDQGYVGKMILYKACCCACQGCNFVNRFLLGNVFGAALGL